MSKSKESIKAAGVISTLSHDGRGITHIDGKTTFVEGALPGETVQFSYVKRRKQYDEARVDNIIIPAEGRQVPKCHYFAICGGCSLQHMDTKTQLDHKQAVLLEQLRHMGGVIAKDVLPAFHSSHSFGYRRKARLGVRYVDKKQKLLIGFREKQGRYLADLDSCDVLHSSIGSKISLLRDFLLTLDGYLFIPQLEITVGDHATAIIIRHLKPFSENDLIKLKAFAKAHSFHLYLQPGGNETVSLFYPSIQPPRLSYALEDYQLEMLFHPTDFIQVNKEVNEQLIKLALELLLPTSQDQILDLFCGMGNFTLPLARRCRFVLGIEGSQNMVERANENCQHNHITNAAFECHDLTNISYNKWKEQHFDGILLDPPRTGALEIVKILPELNANKIVYVSCNPATLARDAGVLCQNGYELAKVGVLDMFPHTSHVESIALFIKK